MQLHQGNQEGENANFPTGDDSLAATLYRNYAPKLFAYVCRHLPTVDDAEDMLLEVFLVVLEREGQLALMLQDEQKAWIWTVARNRIIDYHRRHHRQRSVPLEYVEQMIDEDATPEQVALQQEEHDHLRSHLQRLPPVQQEVLQLRFTGGLRCAEIATVLHKREGAIRTMLSRALNTLRNIYEQ